MASLLLAAPLAATPAMAVSATDGSVPVGVPASGRQALASGDGWGSAGVGTSGGSAAAPDQVHVVDSRTALIDALGGDNATNAGNDTPKLVYIRGVIDGFESGRGRGRSLVSCADLADPEYDFGEYLATYDPAVWGRDTEPEGPLEDARERSMRNQQAQTVINIGPNTTLYGMRGAELRHVTLMLNRADNVIVRNLELVDGHDCFPQWDPTDGSAGNWNSNWDFMSVRRSSNLWIDHNTFRSTMDLPEYFGRKFEVYDGQLDISHNADLVTVSHNVFANHDKVMLIGSTDNPGSGDPGLLNVTLRHNVFAETGQRTPRVRFGKVDAYNNYYALRGDSLTYAWGVGFSSALYAENNFFRLARDVDPATLIAVFNGTAMTERGTWARIGNARAKPVSVLGAYNAVNDPPLGTDAGWTPTLRRYPAMPAKLVPLVVPALAGADHHGR